MEKDNILDVEVLTGRLPSGFDIGGDVAIGDISPSMNALVVNAEGGELSASVMKWGFPGREGGRLLINARSETAMERYTFADSVRSRRCVMPAAWFYEWDRDRSKVTFSQKGCRTIYLAGFYDIFGEEQRFIILTTAANDSVSATHDRMPLMIDRNDIREWIFNDDATKNILKLQMPDLTARQDYEQLRFFSLNN